MALTDITLTVNKQKLTSVPATCVILCDIVNASIYNAGTAQILRIIQSDSDLSLSTGSDQYHQVKSSAHSFNQIQITIKAEDLQDLGAEWPHPEVTRCSCTLHFTKE